MVHPLPSFYPGRRPVRHRSRIFPSGMLHREASVAAVYTHGSAGTAAGAAAMRSCGGRAGGAAHAAITAAACSVSICRMADDSVTALLGSATISSRDGTGDERRARFHSAALFVRFSLARCRHGCACTPHGTARLGFPSGRIESVVLPCFMQHPCSIAQSREIDYHVDSPGCRGALSREHHLEAPRTASMRAPSSSCERTIA